jgi:hypothetical protein
METILRLASIPENYIILKCHTRGSGGLTNEELNSLCENQNVLIADNAIHSPFIIGISDCVICFGSSIGLEAMLRGVPHINPTYLHENSTIYEKSKISESVSNLNDLMTAIERIRFKKGSPQKSEVISSDPCINEVVYGGVEGRRVLNDYTNLIIESMNGK